MLKKKLKLRVLIQDPFLLAKSGSRTKINELESSSVSRYYTRQFRLSLSWNFGTDKQVQSTNRSGIDEESNRIR